MSAGSSGTPLPKKLGIGPDTRVLVLGDPLAFDLDALASQVDREPGGDYDVVLLFCPTAGILTANFDRASAAHTLSGSLWVCWPKRSSGIAQDLDDGTVRAHGLTHGRVDVKVAAVDPVWSALKFVRRVSDRT